MLKFLAKQTTAVTGSVGLAADASKKHRSNKRVKAVA